MEKWKRICINNEITDYEISNFGRCRNINKLGWKTKGILTPKFNKYNGYCSYCITTTNGTKNYKYAHRLVAEAFIPNPQNKEQVNHKDGNKTNNHYTNLEWSTRKENMKHCFDHELCSTAKKVRVYNLEGNFIGEYVSLMEAHRQLGLPTNWNANIGDENRHSRGFQFKFEDDNKPVKDIMDTCKYSTRGLVQLTKDGKFVKYYEKMTLAYKDLGVRDNGAISQCCKGNRNSFHGCKWMYANDYFKN